MKVELTAVVTGDDGGKFMDANIVYYGVPREVYPLLEADFLSVFAKWNAWDQEAQQQKKQGKQQPTTA